MSVQLGSQRLGRLCLLPMIATLLPELAVLHDEILDRGLEELALIVPVMTWWPFSTHTMCLSRLLSRSQTRDMVTGSTIVPRRECMTGAAITSPGRSSCRYAENRAACSVLPVRVRP